MDGIYLSRFDLPATLRGALDSHAITGGWHHRLMSLRPSGPPIAASVLSDKSVVKVRSEFWSLARREEGAYP